MIQCAYKSTTKGQIGRGITVYTGKVSINHIWATSIGPGFLKIYLQSPIWQTGRVYHAWKSLIALDLIITFFVLSLLHLAVDLSLVISMRRDKKSRGYCKTDCIKLYTHTTMTSVRIISYNVNGVNNPIKHKKILHQLKKDVGEIVYRRTNISPSHLLII